MIWYYVSSAITLFVLFALWACVQIYKTTTSPKLKELLYNLLYHVDAQCDAAEDATTKSQIIMALQALLGWKRLFIPAVLIGIVLDVLVKIIRRLGIPDLHRTDATESPKDNFGEGK